MQNQNKPLKQVKIIPACRRRKRVMLPGLIFSMLLPAFRYIVLPFCTIALFSMASSAQSIDSLEKAVNNKNITDIQRVNALNILSRDLVFIDQIRSSRLSNEALRTSLKINYPIGQANAYRILASIYSNNNFDIIAAEYTQKAFKIFQTYDDNEGIANCYITMGHAFRKLQNRKEEILYHKKAFEIFSRLKIPGRIAVAAHNLGESYFTIGEFKKSRALTEYAIKINDSLKNYPVLSNCYKVMGKLEYALGNSKQAEIYFKRVLAISKKLGPASQKIATAESLIQLAAINEHKGQNKLQLSFLKEAAAYSQENLLSDYLQPVYSALIKYYASEKNQQEVLKYLAEYNRVSALVTVKRLRNDIELRQYAIQIYQIHEKEILQLEWENIVTSQQIKAKNKLLIIALIFAVILIGLIIVLLKYLHEAKKAKQVIKESEEKYKNFVEQASDVIVIYSFDGTIHEFNNSACVLSGYNREEFAKLKLTDILVGELIANPDNYKAVMAGEIITFSRQMKQKDGLLIELEVTVKMMEDGRVIAFGRDITERKKAATKLEASEKKLRQVLSSTTDNFYVINRNYEVILINEVAEKNLLIAWGKPVKSGTNLLDVIPEKSEEPIIQNFEEVFKGKRIEYELQHTQHELPAWLLINFTPVIDEMGEIIGATVVAKDITERKKAENELKDSEETRRLIMNSALDAIVGMDTKGLITIWTPQAEKIFGWKEEEAVGKKLSETIIPHQYREAHQRGLAHYMQSGKGPVLSKIIEITALRKGGQEFPIELAIVPVKKGEDEFFCAFIRDITEQKKAEETIQKEKNLSESIINSLPGVFYFYDENLKLLRWNKQLETVTGYSAAELTSMNPAAFFDGEDKEYMKQKSRKVFADGKGDIEASFTTKDGRKVPYYFTGLLMQYEGKPSILGIGIDMTERKKAEEDIREKNKQLQLLSTHLQNIREEERTHMAREIHDELGQQLTMIKINATWLKEKLVDADEKIVQRSNELVNMLSGTIKTVRRIAYELRPSLLDDMGLGAALEWQTKDFAKRTRINIVLDYPEEELSLSDDEKTGLFRIVQESLTNVSRYANAKDVLVVVKISSDQLLMIITDNGIGFDKATISSRKTLGILGMRERTSMMNGTYEIESTPGVGTNVYVTIPHKA